MRRSSNIGGAVVALLVAAAAPLRAQSETALAETLYKQGRELMAENKFAEACPKFAESFRLDPVTGTLLNLATCHEREGKLATAWSEFNDAISAARRDGRDDRVRYAEEHLAAIEPRLSRLTVNVAEGAAVPGLDVTINGTRLGSAALGVAAPLDPGEYVVAASAPGRKDWSTTVTIAPERDSKVVEVPVLELAPVEPSPAATPPAPAPPPTAPPQRDVLVERPTPTAVYVSGSVTLALLAGAAITSSMYVRDNGEKAEDSVRRLGYVNLGFWAGAAIGAGLTSYLYLTRPERTAGMVSRTVVHPWFDASGAGLGLRTHY